MIYRHFMSCSLDQLYRAFWLVVIMIDFTILLSISIMLVITCSSYIIYNIYPSRNHTFDSSNDIIDQLPHLSVNAFTAFMQHLLYSIAPVIDNFYGIDIEVKLEENFLLFLLN